MAEVIGPQTKIYCRVLEYALVVIDRMQKRDAHRQFPRELNASVSSLP
jgi:hypothetical protein